MLQRMFSWKKENSPIAASILSHSSRIKCLTCFRDRTLERASARIRPGVPTTIWGQFFFSTSSSFLIIMPPKKTAIFTLLLYLLKRSYSLLIWKASSRVCASTRTDTCRDNKTVRALVSVLLVASAYKPAQKQQNTVFVKINKHLIEGVPWLNVTQTCDVHCGARVTMKLDTATRKGIRMTVQPTVWHAHVVEHR